MSERRVVCTGMGVITRLGDEPGIFHSNLLEGRSGVTQWSFNDDDRVYSAAHSRTDLDEALTQVENVIARACRKSPARAAR